jgi:hypothetical protein
MYAAPLLGWLQADAVLVPTPKGSARQLQPESEESLNELDYRADRLLHCS